MLATCLLPSLSENCFIRFLSIFYYWPKHVSIFSNLFSVSKLCLSRNSSLEKQKIIQRNIYNDYPHFLRFLYLFQENQQKCPLLEEVTTRLPNCYVNVPMMNKPVCYPKGFPPFFKLWNNIFGQDLTCLDSTSSFCVQFVKSLSCLFCFLSCICVLEMGIEFYFFSPKSMLFLMNCSGFLESINSK